MVHCPRTKELYKDRWNSPVISMVSTCVVTYKYGQYMCGDI